MLKPHGRDDARLPRLVPKRPKMPLCPTARCHDPQRSWVGRSGRDAVDALGGFPWMTDRFPPILGLLFPQYGYFFDMQQYVKYMFNIEQYMRAQIEKNDMH